MYWNTIEDFTQWKNSATFKETHAGSNNTEQESPILGSGIISEVVSALGPIA
ncbi:hypothetical protein MKY88_12900 [Lysinibacillus sp. FSL R7-0073]|uniref:hypothetical protein n=1 Tax=Lysinibacillus TaxID=400634 RepID=UPI002E220057